MPTEITASNKKKAKQQSGWVKHAKRDKYLLMLIALPMVYYIIFHYIPMFGIIMSFQDYNVGDGFFNSPWVGFQWFKEFFNSIYFGRLMKNTILLSVYSLVWEFPIPIIFALMLNELKDGPFKKATQTISYLPHFISVVVVVGMLYNFLSPVDGIVNKFIVNSGGSAINFLGESKYFRPLYVGSGVWQNFGWDSIIYLAALSAVDPQLYEAAKIDGAGKFKQLLHVTLPSISSTIIILLIMRVGNLMNVGFEKVMLMYSPATYDVADVISTYVYRRGIIGAQFSFGAAVGLFNSLINFVLLIAVNSISRKMSEISLW